MKIRAVSLDKARKHNYKNMAIAARCKDNKNRPHFTTRPVLLVNPN